MDQELRKRHADDLRRMAEMIETLPLGTEMEPRVCVQFHNICTLEDLRAATRGVQGLAQDSSGEHHWVEGYVGCLEITAFYKAGLLGKTRRKAVTIVDQEASADLSLLSHSSVV